MNECNGIDARRGKVVARKKFNAHRRALRSAIDLSKLGDYTLTLDCDVLQADGGTRTAAITGSFIAAFDAITHLQRKKILLTDPIKWFVASVSVGIHRGEAILDLDYHEDSNAETDMNVVMNDQGKFIEVQGTAEGHPFSEDELQRNAHTRPTRNHRVISQTTPRLRFGL